MSLRILIVDDEEIIRNGIKRKIERLIPHAQIVGSAQDAADGLEVLKVQKPNVIITDIRMPEVNGLEFIKMVKEIDPGVKFIVVSGYQDFEYARSALKLGVKDYLLKPIENEHLKKILLDLESSMEKEVRSSLEYSDLKMKARTGMDSLKDKYLSDIVFSRENLDMDQVQKNLESLGIAFAHQYLTAICIIISAIDNTSDFSFRDDLALLRFSIRNIAEEMLSPAGSVTTFDNIRDEKQIVIILNHKKPFKPNDSFDIISACNKLIYLLNKHLKVLVSLGIGNSYDSLKRLPGSYTESHTAAVQKITLGENKVISINDLPGHNRIEFFLNEENKMLLSSYIKDGNYKRAFEIVDKIFGIVKEKNLPYSSIKILYMEILLLLSRILKEMGGNLDKVFEQDIFSEAYIMQFSSIQALHTWLNNCITSICSYIGELSKSQGKKVVDEIKEYIENSYHTEISLNDMAAKYYLNPNYLSQLFKSETGENFVNYLTRVRMEKARDLLLNTDLKSYKIAEMVGYGNPRYFSDVFQKYFGKTPTEFREQK